MKTFMFSDDVNRALVTVSEVAASSAPVLDSKIFEVAGTVISTLAYALDLAKEKQWVRFEDHPILTPNLTPNELAHKAELTSIDDMQTRLSYLKMALDEYHSGFETTAATVEVLTEGYRKVETLSQELMQIASATTVFFNESSQVMQSLEECRQALQNSLTPLVSTLQQIAPAAALAPTISPMLEVVQPMTNSLVPIGDQIQTGLTAYNCLNTWKKFRYYSKTGWNKKRFVNLAFETMRTVADVGNSIGYQIPPIANLAITLGVFGTRLFVDRERTDLDRLSEGTHQLRGKSKIEMFDFAKEYVPAISQMEIELLRKIKRKLEQENKTQTPEYTQLLDSISKISRAGRLEGPFFPKTSMIETHRRLNELLQINQTLLLNGAVSDELRSLRLIVKSLMAFKQQLPASRSLKARVISSSSNPVRVSPRSRGRRAVF